MKTKEEIRDLICGAWVPLVYCQQCDRFLYVADDANKVTAIVAEDVIRRHIDLTDDKHLVIAWFPIQRPTAA